MYLIYVCFFQIQVQPSHNCPSLHILCARIVYTFFIDLFKFTWFVSYILLSIYIFEGEILKCILFIKGIFCEALGINIVFVSVLKLWIHFSFTDVVARWPGSTHDATIFQESGLRRWLEEEPRGWLVGDSGYPLRPYLLTPKVSRTLIANV